MHPSQKPQRPYHIGHDLLGSCFLNLQAADPSYAYPVEGAWRELKVNVNCQPLAFLENITVISYIQVKKGGQCHGLTKLGDLKENIFVFQS